MEVHAPAQPDNQFQLELFQLKEEFENNLRSNGENDPLNVWYEYIMKLEDGCLKNGTVHLILPILEKCLQLFKTDNRYTNDRRNCKLWIKYIGLQQENPIELFTSLHTNNICTKCSDLYQAWALYHELTGDFKQANMVFEMGKRFFAEPAEELDIGQKKLVFMAGLHAIYGPDELRLYERKKELNALHRVKFHNQHTFYNICQLKTQGLPLFDVRYLTNTSDLNGSSSIVPKEDNIILPKVEKVSEGIRLYPDFATVNHDDFSTWEVPRFLPDADANLPDKKCMYLKHEVYKDDTEYSPEEIRARTYYEKKIQTQHIPIKENDHHMLTETSLTRPIENLIKEDKKPIIYQDPNQLNHSSYPNVSSSIQTSKFLGFSPQYNNHLTLSGRGDGAPYQQQVHSYEDKKNNTQQWQVTKSEENNSFIKSLWQDESVVQVPKPSFQISEFQIHEDTKLQNFRDEIIKHSPLQEKGPHKQPFAERQCSPEKQFPPQSYPQSVNPIVDELFGSSFAEQENQRTPSQNQSQNFAFPDPRTPKGAHKYLSQPLPEPVREPHHQILSQPEFAQPHDIKKPFEPFHIFDDAPTSATFNESACNTQVFNFNFPKVSSTPINEKKMLPQFAHVNSDMKLEQNSEHNEVKFQKQQRLFDEKNNTDDHHWNQTCTPQKINQQDKLSVIMETTKEHCSSSGSSGSVSGTTLKTTTFHSGYNSLKMIPEDAMEINNSQNKIYVQNPQQINQSAIEQSYRVPQIMHQLHNSYFESSIKFPVPNELNTTKTPSPKKDFQYNQSQFNSLHVTRDQSIKQPQILNENSYIYIPDDTSNISMSPAKLSTQFDNLRSPYQSQQYNAKVPRERKMERDRQFDPKNMEGLNYEGSNDSNSLKDVWGRSPAKGSRMDIDSNPDLRMDYNSCSEPPIDESILLRTPSDPFSSKITKVLLRKVGFPQQRHLENYVVLQKIPRLISKETVVLGDERYLLGTVIGKGTYGQVFKATRLSTNELVAMKLQKPMHQWEFYICSEIQHRIRNPHVLKAFMSVDVGYFCQTSSLLVSEFCRYGSLLDLNNKVKQMTGKGLKELVVIYFANEIITIINALHQCQIIHADIKPDNFLVTRMPPDYGHPCIQLIDFGCSIDMTLFPKGQTFKKVVNTENFTCPEMKDGRPWSYQTDIFCAAATVHVLLFEKYLQLQKKNTIWCISTKIQRYLRQDLWTTFFYQMFNIESCDKLPDLTIVKKSFEHIISEQSEELQMEMRNISNSVNGR